MSNGVIHEPGSRRILAETRSHDAVSATIEHMRKLRDEEFDWGEVDFGWTNRETGIEIYVVGAAEEDIEHIDGLAGNFLKGYESGESETLAAHPGRLEIVRQAAVIEELKGHLAAPDRRLQDQRRKLEAEHGRAMAAAEKRHRAAIARLKREEPRSAPLPARDERPEVSSGVRIIYLPPGARATLFIEGVDPSKGEGR